MTRIWVFLTVTLMTCPAVAGAQDTVTYYHTDAIGSVRMITDANGGVLQRYDYLPFGGDCAPNPPCATQPPDTKQFVGKDRDTDTTFDYFGARYYDSVNGRFTTVDPMLDIDNALVDPQRWNRYAYAYNNPFRFVDPDGKQGLEGMLWADYELWVRGRISDAEYQARVQQHAKAGVITAGVSAAAGGLWLGGPSAWRAAIGCFLSPSCQGTAIDVAEGLAGAPPSGLTSVALGAARELAVAELVGGKVVRMPIKTIFGSSEVDVLGAAGEYIGVGGTSKGFNLSRFGQQLKILQEAAKNARVRAQFYFERGTPEDLLQVARERLGADNVFVFDR